MRENALSSATSQATSKIVWPRYAVSIGSGASRVQITKPSGAGSPEATPSWNGGETKRSCADAVPNGTSAQAPAAAARRLNSRREMPRLIRRSALDAGPVREAALLRRGLRDARVRGHAVREPDVAADDAAAADRDAPEHGRARVDRHVVLDDRVARLALDQAAGGLVDLEALRAERHALVERDAITDDRGLADHDAGAVVDEELAADRRAGVDVDAGPPVRVLGDEARQQRHVERIEDVRDAMARDREHAGVGVERLDGMTAGRVVAPGRARVVEDPLAQLRQLFEQRVRDPARFPGGILGPECASFAEPCWHLECEAKLRQERRLDFCDLARDARHG